MFFFFFSIQRGLASFTHTFQSMGSPSYQIFKGPCFLIMKLFLFAAKVARKREKKVQTKQVFCHMAFSFLLFLLPLFLDICATARQDMADIEQESLENDLRRTILIFFVKKTLESQRYEKSYSTQAEILAALKEEKDLPQGWVTTKVSLSFQKEFWHVSEVQIVEIL